jgi:hypothetical protein
MEGNDNLYLIRALAANKELADKVQELEAELARARAAAVQWIAYDGTPETLPAPGTLVLYDASDSGTIERGSIVVYFFVNPGGKIVWEYSDYEKDDFDVKIGDRWAYLPRP